MRRVHDPARGRATRGFSALEGGIAVGLFSVLAVNLTVLTRATQRGAAQQDELLKLEVLASQTLDRLSLALMAARQEAIYPLNTAPLNDPEIRYTISNGVDEDGELVWSDPESVGLMDDGGEVVWRRNPDTDSELRVVWGRYVAEAPLGEILGNGLNDNEHLGDELVDEAGLSFHLEEDGRSVVIQLSLARQSEAGNWVRATTRQRVAFRN